MLSRTMSLSVAGLAALVLSGCVSETASYRGYDAYDRPYRGGYYAGSAVIIDSGPRYDRYDRYDRYSRYDRDRDRRDRVRDRVRDRDRDRRDARPSRDDRPSRPSRPDVVRPAPQQPDEAMQERLAREADILRQNQAQVRRQQDR